MKSISIIFLLFLVCLAPLPSQVLEYAEASRLVPGAEKIRLKEQLLLPNYIRFQPGAEIPAGLFEAYLREQFLQQQPQYSLSFINENQDLLGHIHKRYQQLYDGKAVEGSMLISHAYQGRIYAINGDFFSLRQVLKKPVLTEAQGLQAALDHVGAEQYMWEMEKKKTVSFGQGIWEAMAAQNLPKGELVYVPENANYSEANFRLAWKFDIAARKPFGQTWTFVDAENGHILCQFDQIHTADSTGVAVTRYSGNRPITADFVSPGKFRLREAGRGNGILTLNDQNGNGTVDFEDSDNIWNNSNGNLDEVAGDVHWASEMTYDYYLQKYGRNGLDNNGYRITSYVHSGSRGFFNAYWNGTANYGDGGGNPLTSLDICAHEMTHGLTRFSADLIYQNEPGALNESFSDIFGQAIEAFAKPNAFDWRIGNEIGQSLRNMANPIPFQNPRNYLGNQWYTGSGDNGGVHINSGVQNYWFYLLVDGASGTNDFGKTYNISSIGIDTAAAVAFRNLTVYLTPTSKYIDARFYSIQSAIDLYGNCGRIHQQVTNAWYAVGIGQAYSPNPIPDFFSSTTETCNFPYVIDFLDQSSGASSYHWDFGDGNTSTMANPSHTYAAPGSYTISLKIGGVCGGQDSLLKSNYIQVVQAPASPLVTTPPVLSCQTSAMLTADPQGSDQIRWFDQNGNLLAIGDTFMTLPQGQAHTFYARAIDLKTRQKVGLTDNTGGTGGYLSTDTRSVVFDVNRQITLQSVKVYAQSAGQRIIEYRNANGVVFDAKSVFIPQGESRVELNFFLQPGADQQLGVVGTVDLYATNSNLNYPYEIPNILSIKGTTGNNPQNLFILFYDWEVHEADCSSEPVAVTLTVDTIPSAVVMSAERCGPGQLSFAAATFDSSLNWYDANGQFLTSGTTFMTPYLTTTTDFQVENVRYPSPQSFGPKNASIGRSGYLSDPFDTHLAFRVLQEMRLKSVWVDAQTAGLREIILTDGQGVGLDTFSVTLAVGAQRVELGVELQAGNYRLGGLNMDLMSNSAGVAYPYSINGLIEIYNSSGGLSDYYYFYDWEVQNTACVSSLKTVTATINPGPSASFTYQQSKSTFQFTDDAAGTSPTSWMWDFGDGNSSSLQNPTHTFLAIGTYTVRLTSMDGNCTNSWSETVRVDQVTDVQEEMAKELIQLFPNPGDGTFWVSREDASASLEISVWDMYGKAIQTQKMPAGIFRQQIKMGDHASGTYLIRIQSPDAIQIKKYLLNR